MLLIVDTMFSLQCPVQALRSDQFTFLGPDPNFNILQIGCLSPFTNVHSLTVRKVIIIKSLCSKPNEADLMRVYTAGDQNPRTRVTFDNRETCVRITRRYSAVPLDENKQIVIK